VGPGEPVDAADGLRYQLVDYATDFAGQGAAVQVLRTEFPPGERASPDGRAPPDAKQSTFWVFSKAPLFDAKNREDRFAFTFDKLTTVYATGLQIARDPSTPIVYLGCFLLFAGIGVAFYGAHKRIWAKVDAGKLALAGASHRNADAFSEEFAELCLALDVPLAPSRRAPPESAPTPPALPAPV
jgi:cytochrome c biogenesis protein ResB